MGNSKSKKVQKEPDKFFDREKLKEQRREDLKKKVVYPSHKRQVIKGDPNYQMSPAPASAPAPAHVRSYDDDALDRMRDQLHDDSDAFLLNNILLSVQFFENYERETYHIKNNPISEREHTMDAAMVRCHKHVFFADRLQECVQEHVYYQRSRELTEPLIAPRLFIIYDNVEASEPGDTSDYCAVLDAPFYKIRIEDCKEPGFIKLKKTEVLESSLFKNSDMNKLTKSNSDDSLYTDSEKESNDSDDVSNKVKIKLQESIQVDPTSVNNRGRKRNTTTKEVNVRIPKNTSSENLNDEDISYNCLNDKRSDNNDFKLRKSILKTTRKLSVSMNELSSKSCNNSHNDLSLDNIKAEDTETSGYRSNSSSRHAESSETESDYGYSTITELTTPKKVQLKSNSSVTSGVLPDECWTPIDVRVLNWSDDDDDNVGTDSQLSLSKNLFETHYYLNSVKFMNNFVDNFIVNLGSGLDFSQDSINNALTQGASVYCNTMKNGLKLSYEVAPALIAAWPNAANQWIIRERKIIQNPRTNFSYQWPTKYMVNKAIGFGCLLVPIGFRPKRGLNPNQELQWKIIFPAAERYLESCLAHSHMRCYLFAIILYKAFMENEGSKIGIDASHIKNHLFWECEDNYAKWPEDRLGESLRLFLESFFAHFAMSRLPNYFIKNCNEAKSIPQPILLKLHRRLKDILEAPVMHLLYAIDKLKYIKKDYYPTFNVHRLYNILTCKNPLRIINPNLAPSQTVPPQENSDGEYESNNNIWDRAKAQDKTYKWRKERERRRQMEERRSNMYKKRQKTTSKDDREINRYIILPQKMDVERRRLVLEFFIPHFIAMARSSEKFEALKQAVIYLEQAQRLCILLREEPAGDMTAYEYLDVIRDKLADCQRKLVNQGGFKLPTRGESVIDKHFQNKPIRKHRPKYEHIISQDSPTENSGIAPFTFVDVHIEETSKQVKKQIEDIGQEESKL